MEHMNYDAGDLQAITSLSPNLEFRSDEDGVMTARQLDYVKTRVYEAEMPPLTGLQMVPVSTEVPEWAETYTWRMYDEVGMAKFIANYADDLPRADVKGTEQTARIKDLGDAYGYNIAELRTSNATGTNLPTRKANAARRAIDQKLNRVALIGDLDYGFYGIANHPNIGETTITGDWSNETTTGSTILTDLTTLYNAVQNQSYDFHTPNTLAVTPEARTAITTKFVKESSDKTVWQFFTEQYPGVSLISSRELAGVDSGQDIALMYERNVDNMSLELPMAFNQLAAQARNLELVVPCLARCGGVTLYYPLSITKAVGV